MIPVWRLVKPSGTMCIVFWVGRSLLVRLRLKEVLEEKNISQSKLSRMADVSLNTIQEMIHNPYHDVRINTLDKIARALEIPVTDLYEREDQGRDIIK
jgi:DNA-binding Xre family transcriptional regulator